MKKNIFLFITITLSCLFITFSIVSIVNAEPISDESLNGQALEIAPPVIILSADPGETLTTQINIRDISSGSLLVKGEINDFTAAGEDGTPKILEESETSAYSLKNWVSFPSELLLNAKQLKKLPITINIPSNASPGGYYGTIRFTATAPELKDTGVSLSASLGALLMIRVKGEAKEELSIKDFFASNIDTRDENDIEVSGKVSNFFESAPIQFNQRLTNTGNVYEQPSGLVTITDMFGKKIATLGINQPPRQILPDSTRKFTQLLDKSVIGNKILFGRYKADLNVVYGDNKQTINSSLTFWVIPYRTILAIITAIIVLFIILRSSIKRYNKHIIKKSRYY